MFVLASIHMFFFPLSKSFEGILRRKLALRIVEISPKWLQTSRRMKRQISAHKFRMVRSSNRFATTGTDGICLRRNTHYYR